MQKTVQVDSVEQKPTKSGNTRYVLRDTEGNEYTTFRPAIGEQAARFEGKRAAIEFHEEERNGFQNVYLDSVAPARGTTQAEPGCEDADEAAWRTAVEAAPLILGEDKKPHDPDEVYERLEPFKRRVADDIKRGEG